MLEAIKRFLVRGRASRQGQHQVVEEVGSIQPLDNSEVTSLSTEPQIEERSDPQDQLEPRDRLDQPARPVQRVPRERSVRKEPSVRKALWVRKEVPDRLDQSGQPAQPVQRAQRALPVHSCSPRCFP